MVLAVEKKDDENYREWNILELHVSGRDSQDL